jgi:formyltetrahydrofolate hydrolase
MMMRFVFEAVDFGHFRVYDKTGKCSLNVIISNETHAMVLVDFLNKVCGKVEYQERVIDKCIKNEKRYSSMIEDYEDDIIVLNKEKDILKKIICEMEYDNV